MEKGETGMSKRKNFGQNGKSFGQNGKKVIIAPIFGYFEGAGETPTPPAATPPVASAEYSTV